MNAPTAYDVVLSGLRDLGVTSLDPNTPANQPFPIEPTDLTDICQIATSALQEAAQESGQEQLNQPASFYLRGPTNVTLTATQGSTTISAFTTYDGTWMPGCTIRVSGDNQDNELLSATQLARPYVGGSASGITAVIFDDCITMDQTVDHPTGPLVLAQNGFVYQASTRQEFATRLWQTSLWQGIQPSVGWYFLPFWGMSPKPDGAYPTMYFMDTYYDPTLAYVVKRLRITPMPNVAQSLAWTNKMLPPRISPADAVSGYTTLTASGATSDTNINQNYTNLCDLNGYRAFPGVTHNLYAAYFHPGLSNFILNSTVNLANTPAAYWKNTTSAGTPLGTYAPQGTATGTVTVTSSDQPGKILTMPNGWIENLFMPIFRMQLGRLPTYKNKEIRPEVERQYQLTLRRIRASTVGPSRAKTGYI